jgi:MFS transporter, Spinster family, sphingosine-1-phosphate transporter
MATSEQDRSGGGVGKLQLVLFLAVMAGVSFLYSLDRLMLGVLAQPIKTSLSLSDSTFGLIVGLLFAITTTLFSFPIARLADRTSRSGVLAGCLILWSATTALCGTVANATHLAIARVGVGVGEAGAMSIVHALIGAGLPPRRRAFALGVVGAGIYAGSMGAFILGGWLAQTVGWRIAFMLVAAPGVVLACLIPRFARLDRQSSEPRERKPDLPKAERPKSDLAQTLRKLATSPAFILITLSAVMCGGIATSLGAWIAAFTMRSYGLTIGEAGLWLGLATGASSIVGQLGAGYFCSRVRPEHVMRIPAITFGIAAVLYIVAFHAPDARSLMLILIFPSFFAATWYPALYASLQNVVSGESRAQATSIANIFIQILGNGFGPSIVGWASDALAPTHGQDSLRVALTGTAMLGVVASALMLTLDFRLRRDGRRAVAELAVP